MVITAAARVLPPEEEACKGDGVEGHLAKPLQTAALSERMHRVASPMDSGAPQEVVSQVIFNRSAFLSRMEGDEALGSEIIEIFLDQCPKLLGSIRQAAERHDPSLLERAAHALKGSLGDIAAPQAFEAARTLEQMGRAGNLEGSGSAITSLEVSLQQLEYVLRHMENKATS